MSKPAKIELNYLRIALCCIIVITHILTQYATANELDAQQMKTLYWVRMLLIIGTPCFIMLSQLLVTMNYKDKLPPHYLMNRIKYILLPYLSIGLLYSYSESAARNVSFVSQVIENILTFHWYGYFVIVIMQFSILNAILYRINPRVLKSKLLLVVSLIITTVFLYCFNTMPHVQEWMEQHYFVSSETFIIGWLGYYFMGSFIGIYYEQILAFLKEHPLFVIVAVVLTYFTCIVPGRHDFGDVSSFQFQIMPYVFAAFFQLLLVSTNFKTFMSRTAVQVSAFSFFIYLFHPIILDAIYSYTERFDDRTLVFIPLTLLIVIGCCIGTGSILREFNIFKYVIGKQPYKV